MRSSTLMLLSLGASLGVLALALGCGSSSRPSSAVSAAPGTTAAGPTATLAPAGRPRYASPPPGTPVRRGLVQVAYRNITIRPDVIRVKVGSTIRWTNLDSVEHNVTSTAGPASFASANLSEGHSFQVRVERPGVIHYLCTIHPVTMNGTIEVVR